MTYQAIFFDVDGVVVKSPYMFSERLQKEYGIPMEKMMPFFTGVFRDCSNGKADLKEELAKVIEDWGWKGTLEDLLNFWFTKGTEIDAQVLDLVAELQAEGIHCFLATDQEKYRGEYLRDLLVTNGPFEKIFFSADLGAQKKTATFWEQVFAQVEVPRDQTLFIDDDEEKVEAVHALGIPAILYAGIEDLKHQIT